MSAQHWSSRTAFYLVTVGAAVGLGSIWRFPYLAGSSGGSAFVFVFLLACLMIAVPLLVAEFLLGRWSRRSPPQAAGEIAARFGGSRGWNVIGWTGALACFLVFTYYPLIAGWVLAYAVKFATGRFVGSTPEQMAQGFAAFLRDPWELAGWHLAFLLLVSAISALGLQRGIEATNRVRAPTLLVLLLALVGYALATGDVERGLTFAFAPDFSKIDANVVLAAVGQAFYATGVGMAIMMAYGAYVGHDVSLLRSAVIITLSIIVVSVLASVMIFPLVFAYGMSPAEGPQLVFEVLPRAFARMPAGQFVGTAFYVLLVFAALTPSIGALEPAVAWLQQRHRFLRPAAVALVAAVSWVLGFISTLSFNVWADWHPLDGVPLLAGRNPWAIIDFVASNLMMPLGALATSLFVGWRIAARVPAAELDPMTPAARRVVLWLLRWVCPAAIVVVLGAALLAAL
jgi:NSS family neurotransmitter:Na+ symporter